jgi:hypothetical protein
MDIILISILMLPCCSHEIQQIVKLCLNEMTFTWSLKQFNTNYNIYWVFSPNKCCFLEVMNVWKFRWKLQKCLLTTKGMIWEQFYIWLNSWINASYNGVTMVLFWMGCGWAQINQNWCQSINFSTILVTFVYVVPL